MNAIAILYAGRLAPEAVLPFSDGRSAVDMAIERAAAFSGVSSVVLLGEVDGLPETRPSGGPAVARFARAEGTGKAAVLKAIAELGSGFDLIYLAWADSPLLDAGLAGALAKRHFDYAAEYSYADGWPEGLAPELLAPATAAALAALAAGDSGQVERDLLFSVIQKDINSFDIETELAPVDLRQHRLRLAADSRRNRLLVERWLAAGYAGAADAERLIRDEPGLLRLLPAYYSVQVTAGCLQTCRLCPYPRTAGDVLSLDAAMPAAAFDALAGRIAAFSGDAVISLSPWGEPSRHPDFQALAKSVLDRPGLSLLIETSGLGWTDDTLAALAAAAASAAARREGRPPITWIVSLESDDPVRYAGLRGEGFAEAQDCAQRLLRLFPASAYVQTLRVKGDEDDLERFYRAWKAKTPNVIVQKPDDFCAFLPNVKATDLSPVTRQPCHHAMRDLTVLLDGRVPFCREAIGLSAEAAPDLGNVFDDGLAAIWDRGAEIYARHCRRDYPSACAGCDEYYTYNF
jgi:spiro-SPASM protein